MRTSSVMAVLAAAVLGFSAAAHGGEDHDHGDEADHEKHTSAEGEHHGNDDDHGDRAEHFEGKPAKNLDQALKNLRQTNAKLEKILAKEELSSDDMTRVHKLSYTLENAMARIDEEMEAMGADLEWVHKASERMDEQTVRARGKSYLEATNKIAE